MSLSCSCRDEIEPGEWGYYEPDDFTRMPVTFRRKRCYSCGKLINAKELVARFRCFKRPDTEVECKIYGEDGEIPIAPKYFCEECGEIFFNLSAAGFCGLLDSYESMRDKLEEYWKMTGFNPEKYKSRTEPCAK